MQPCHMVTELVNLELILKGKGNFREDSKQSLRATGREIMKVNEMVGGNIKTKGEERLQNSIDIGRNTKAINLAVSSWSKRLGQVKKAWKYKVPKRIWTLLTPVEKVLRNKRSSSHWAKKTRSPKLTFVSYQTKEETNLHGKRKD